MEVLWTLPWFALLIIAADAGYYKILPPPPPPLPPGSVHYGSHPPPPRYRRPAPHYPPPPPPPPVPPHFAHHHHPPRSPPIQPLKSASQRYHQRWPHPPPKPLYPSPYSWKNYNTFQAPVVKESFSTPQSTYMPTHFKDDERGPIHTIPAPNLAPLDNQASYFNPGYNHANMDYGYKNPLATTQEDLAAVLKHGLTKVNVPQPIGYQVTEDPSLHQPISGSNPYFAPDPDPEIPPVKLPPTSDPHSQPSNGQVPLDLYLQKEAEKNSASQQITANQDSNKLTAQELFKLLNYDPANPVSLIPQAQLQQHILQPNIQFYNPVLFPQAAHIDSSQNILTHQQSSQQFAPQYQSFNYDEQTQQGAYGSDSFPPASINLNIHGRNELSYDNTREPNQELDDNDVEGSDKVNTYERTSENEIVQQKPEERKIASSSKDTSESSKILSSNKATGPVTSTAYSSKGHLQINVDKSSTNYDISQVTPVEQGRSLPDPVPTQSPPQQQLSTKPDDNVELHKSIQIYENTYSTNEDLMQKEIKNLNEFSEDYTDEERIVKGMIIGRPIELRSNQKSIKDNAAYADSIPYGSRIRPKRF